jgi:hypothetical protein
MAVRPPHPSLSPKGGEDKGEGGMGVLLSDPVCEAQ